MSNQYKKIDIRINIQEYMKSILTSSINKNKVLKGNNVCPITYQQIKDRYMNCYTCKKNFDEDALKTWLSKKFTCPTCRKFWSNPFVFINCKNKVILKEDKYDSDEALKSISDSDDEKYDSDEELKSISDSDDDKYDSD